MSTLALSLSTIATLISAPAAAQCSDFYLEDDWDAPNLHVGDFDADGVSDVFRSTEEGWEISWSGVTNWQPLNELTDSMHDIAFADFNGDGETDVFRATGEQWEVSWSGVTEWQFLNTSQFTLYQQQTTVTSSFNWLFLCWETITTHSEVPLLAFADFNGDKESEVFLSTGGKWHVSRSGTSQWQELNVSGFPYYITQGQPTLGFGDFDGDRSDDVFRPDGALWNVSWGGASSWNNPTSLSVSATTLPHLALRNFDDDCESETMTDDVFWTTGSDWRLSRSGVNSWDVLQSGRTEHVSDLAFGDFDGDCRTDVFQTTGTDWEVSYGGTGGWTFLNALDDTL